MPQGSNFEYCYSVMSITKSENWVIQCVLLSALWWPGDWWTQLTVHCLNTKQVRRMDFSKISNLDLTYIVKVTRGDLVTRLGMFIIVEERSHTSKSQASHNLMETFPSSLHSIGFHFRTPLRHQLFGNRSMFTSLPSFLFSQQQWQYSQLLEALLKILTLLTNTNIPFLRQEKKKNKGRNDHDSLAFIFSPVHKVTSVDVYCLFIVY